MTPGPDAKHVRYRLLVELMATLVSTHQVDDVLAALHRRIGTLFGAPVTLLALRQPDGSWQCVTLEGRDVYRHTLPAQADGVLERALDGRLTYTGDLLMYASTHGLTLRSLDPGANLRYTHSWMGAPLHMDRQPAGVLSIQSYTRAAFSDDDLEFLQLLSTHLGIAMENALLRQRLEQEARTDALTGLLNRRSFTHSGERAARGEGPCCLAILDVQQFKRVNDELGHVAGDKVLSWTGSLLHTHAAGSGQAFRLGGDEFAVLFTVPLTPAHRILQNLLQHAQHKPCPVPLPIRLNIGLSAWQPGQPFEALVQQADARMYEAKLSGVQLAPL